jgi:hypothetical protein
MKGRHMFIYVTQQLPSHKLHTFEGMSLHKNCKNGCDVGNTGAKKIEENKIWALSCYSTSYELTTLLVSQSVCYRISG